MQQHYRANVWYNDGANGDPSGWHCQKDGKVPSWEWMIVEPVPDVPGVFRERGLLPNWDKFYSPAPMQNRVRGIVIRRGVDLTRAELEALANSRGGCGCLILVIILPTTVALVSRLFHTAYIVS